MVESKLPGTHIAARLSLWVSETQNLVFIDKISLKLVANVSVFFYELDGNIGACKLFYSFTRPYEISETKQP